MQGDNEHFRAPVTWVLAPFLLGMLGACTGVTGPAGWLLGVACVASLFALGIAWRGPALNPLAWAAGIAGASFIGGLGWMSYALEERPRWRALPAREATLEVELTRVFPAAEDAPTRSCIGIITHASIPVDDLIGQRVYLAAKPLHEGTLIRTMRVKVAGVLSTITDDAAVEGSFDGYLLANAVRFRLARVGVPAIAKPAHPVAATWDAIGTRFERILRHGLPEKHPATGAYVAMFMGRKSELTPPQREAFMRSGTMHLFAISGLHICVIAVCLHTLLTLLRMPPLATMVIGLLLLLVFVEATGGTPSARRAYLMVALVWLGKSLRRPANPLAALMCAATGVLVIEPLALLNMSFQFSYSVVALLLLYGVPLQNRLLEWWTPRRLIPQEDVRWWHRTIDWVVRNLIALTSVSIAASLVALPLGFGLFGLGSPGAVLSNILLVPSAGLAVAGGFASLICGLAGMGPLSILFNHAAALVIAAIAWAAAWAAEFPGMFYHGRFGAAWIAPSIVLGLVALCGAGYAVRWRRPRWLLWAPPGLVAIAVVLLVTPEPSGQQSSIMKSAYELAMERLKQSDPDASPMLTDEQKARLAEIDRVYKGRIAEREIFLNQRLAEARTAGDGKEFAEIQKQLVSERARLEEEREDEKNVVRKAARG